MYALEKAARNYLYFHIKCLLSNSEEYIQNMKTSNLDAFIREPCRYTYNWSWIKTIKEFGKELKEYIHNIHKRENYTNK